MNQARYFLPHIYALSVNSPYLAGEETGMQSNRAEVLAQLPRSGAPPAFESYEDWEAFVDRFARLGIIGPDTRQVGFVDGTMLGFL